MMSPQVEQMLRVCLRISDKLVLLLCLIAEISDRIAVLNDSFISAVGHTCFTAYTKLFADVCSLDYTSACDLSSFLFQPRLETRHITRDDTPSGEFHQTGLLKVIEDLGDRFAQC